MDYRVEIKLFFLDPSKKFLSFKNKSGYYILLKDVLYKRHMIGVSPRCLRLNEAFFFIIFEIYEGFYRGHKSSNKMSWIIINYDFHWSDITKDCISYSKRCQKC